MKLFFSVTTMCAVALSHASVLFSDDFESGNHAAWAIPGSAQVVTNPLGGVNKVINFPALGSGGDLFSPNFAIPATGVTTLSFDYLGTPGPASANGNGGFLGTDDGTGEHWYFGTGGYPTSILLVDDNTWHHYSIVLPQGQTAHLKLEDYAGTEPIAGNAYFDNVSVQAVPEPTSMAALGLGAVGLLRRRRK